MKKKLDKIIDKIFKKGNFYKAVIMLTLILTALCLLVAIIGYFKIVDVNINYKKQELKK
jgi:hypothetical protein